MNNAAVGLLNCTNTTCAHKLKRKHTVCLIRFVLMLYHNVARVRKLRQLAASCWNLLAKPCMLKFLSGKKIQRMQYFLFHKYFFFFYLPHLQTNKTIIILILGMRSADFNCLFMPFYLHRLIILENKPVRLLTDGRAQYNPHPHAHRLHTYLSFFFSSSPPLIHFAASTLITAPAFRPLELPHMSTLWFAWGTTL